MQIYGGGWLVFCFYLLKGKSFYRLLDGHSFILRDMNLFDISSSLHSLIQKVNNRVWLTISKPKKKTPDAILKSKLVPEDNYWTTYSTNKAATWIAPDSHSRALKMVILLAQKL